jgi:hypothetical protein
MRMTDIKHALRGLAAIALIVAALIAVRVWEKPSLEAQWWLMRGTKILAGGIGK